MSKPSTKLVSGYQASQRASLTLPEINKFELEHPKSLVSKPRFQDTATITPTITPSVSKTTKTKSEISNKTSIKTVKVTGPINVTGQFDSAEVKTEVKDSQKLIIDQETLNKTFVEVNQSGSQSKKDYETFNVEHLGLPKMENKQVKRCIVDNEVVNTFKHKYKNGYQPDSDPNSIPISELFLLMDSENLQKIKNPRAFGDSNGANGYNGHQGKQIREKTYNV